MPDLPIKEFVASRIRGISQPREDGSFSISLDVTNGDEAAGTGSNVIRLWLTREQATEFASYIGFALHSPHRGAMEFRFNEPLVTTKGTIAYVVQKGEHKYGISKSGSIIPLD